MSVSFSDPDWIRIQDGKNDPQKFKKKLIYVMLWSAGCCLSGAEFLVIKTTDSELYLESGSASIYTYTNMVRFNRSRDGQGGKHSGNRRYATTARHYLLPHSLQRRNVAGCSRLPAADLGTFKQCWRSVTFRRGSGYPPQIRIPGTVPLINESGSGSVIGSNSGSDFFLHWF